MKKLVSLLLAIVMVMCMSVTAFAAEIKTGDNTIDIPASYTGSSITIVGPDGSATTATVYSVKLEWTGINGVAYKGAQTAYYWDEATLTYKQHDNSTTAGWTDDSDSCTITVTNKSNAAIKATAEFKAAENIGATVTCAFGNNGCTIASAAPTKAQLEAGTVNGSAKTGQITADISASGTLNSGVTSVGTITITIASV